MRLFYFNNWWPIWSIEPKSGKMYTQLEFEYASSIGIPMASFYHAEPHKLPGDKIESTEPESIDWRNLKKSFN